MVFISSRTYGGYDTTGRSPDDPLPHAYETAFAVKWLIEQQINHEPEHAYSAVYPWIGWGPYLWADGLNPRAEDGLIWECDDFCADGVHPCTGAQIKVADLLQRFLDGNSVGVTRWWKQTLLP